MASLSNSTPTPPNQSASFEAQREQMHRQMLSSVSHDLKTPLASVIGSLEIYLRMQQQLPPEKLQTLLHTALQEAYRLDHFVTNILDMGKLENGMVKTRAEMANVLLLLQDCAERMKPVMGSATLTVENVASPIMLQTDTTLLIRAISLLIDNGLKHGGEPASIHLYARSTQEHTAEIRIWDEGPGIPSEMADAIFNKYTRMARQDHQKAGTGLGLAICRGIIELLNGTITVRNRPQGGAEFTIKLRDLA